MNDVCCIEEAGIYALWIEVLVEVVNVATDLKDGLVEPLVQ